MDERLLDLIVECQGRRMDDQRSSVVPPVVEVTAPQVLVADGRSVAAPESPRALGEVEREQVARERPNAVRVDGGRRRLSNGSRGSLDDIFDTLMSAQVSGVCVCVWRWYIKLNKGQNSPIFSDGHGGVVPNQSRCECRQC